MVRFTRSVIRWRWIVVAASVAVAAACLSGVGRLTFSNNYRVFFSDQNPQLRAFESLERIYTKNDSIVFVLQPEDRDVFSVDTLRIVHDLTADAWHVPFSTRVDSITNFQHTRADDDELIVEDLVPDPEALDSDDLRRVRDIALSEPLLRDRLISADGATTGVNVRIHPPGKSRSEISEAVAYSRRLADKVREAHPGMRVELTGTTMLSNAFAEAPEADVRFLLPLMYAVLLGMMLFLLRSVFGALATFAVIVLSAMSAMGIAGWADTQLNGVSVSAPTIILTLAIADSVHILVTMFGEMFRGRDKYEALVESMRINAQPVFLTSLTTVIGFLSLNFSDAPPLRDLGNITAVGVALAWVYSVTFLPALVAILPIRPQQAKAMSTGAMERLAEFVIRRRRPLLYGMGALVFFLGLGMLRFEINDRPVEYFDDSIEFRRATDFTIENLTGFYGMNFSLDSGESGGISDPTYLRKVSDFVDWMRARPDVSHVTTITDTMKRLNKSMHGDDPDFYVLPDNRELAAQYLLLYEMSVPFGLDLNDQINVDKSATRLTVNNADVDFRQLKQFKADAEDWLAKNGLPSMGTAEGSSPAVMFAFIGQRNIEAMVRGTVLAFLLISLVLIVTLRSLRIGALSIIPNVVPIFMAFGLWALLFVHADFAISVVAGVSIGIIVDDTIHFLAKYLRGRREQGLSSADAVRYAFKTVGNALWANSLILVFGFTALAWSSFWPNATMGLLTAVAIGAALLADFLLLPPLLMWLDGGEKERSGGRMANKASSGVAALVILATGIVVCGWAAPAVAETPEEKGLRIIEEADRRDLGWGDWKSEMKMVLANQHGDTSERQLRMKSLENPDPKDGDKTMIVFDHPRDVKGTALLTFTHILESDDQWLFLPALKRVKRISSSNKSGSFMGSEFAYEDFSSQEVAKYTYKWLRDEACGELQCFVIERYPQYENSGYTRQIVWLDQDEYRVQRVDFYDRKDALLKKLTLGGYRRYLDKYWRAHDLFMENAQTGKTTRLTWDGYAFRTGLDESDFTKESLKRVR